MRIGAYAPVIPQWTVKSPDQIGRGLDLSGNASGYVGVTVTRASVAASRS